MWLEPGVTSSTALALQNEYTQGQVARSDWLREVRGKASEGHVRRRPSLRVVRSGWEPPRKTPWQSPRRYWQNTRPGRRRGVLRCGRPVSPTVSSFNLLLLVI